MRVMQINFVGKTLSTGRTTREMHEYFISHGIDSYIATACNSDCDDAYKISSMNSMHVSVALSIITGLELYNSRFQTYKFLKFMDKIKPDVVHIRILHNSFINIGMLMKYLAKHDIATVITLHDMWFLTGKCCYYHNYPCEKWKTGCYNCIALKDDSRHRWFDRTSKMWADKRKLLNAIPRLAIVGNSEWTTNEAKKSYIDKNKKIECIYNWIDLDVFYPRSTGTIKEELGLAKKFIILGVASGWSRNDRKGFDDYLNLARSVPDYYHIVLVGKVSFDGEIPKNITILGNTNDTELLAKYYSMADVYLNLSRGETFGKVSAEAVACGTPIVALDTTANKEIVPPNAGVMISSADPKEIMIAIKTLESKDKKSYEMICRSFAAEKFDKEKNIQAYIDLYKKMLESR